MTDSLETLERRRNAEMEGHERHLKELNAQIAALRKPPLKFKMGDEVLVRGKVSQSIEDGRSVMWPFAIALSGGGYIWVRESDLLSAKPTPGGCHILSKGDDCDCTLCKQSREIATLHIVIEDRDALIRDLLRFPATSAPTVTREELVKLINKYLYTSMLDYDFADTLIERFGAVPDPPKPTPDRGATLAALEALGVTDPTAANAFADQFGAVDDDPYIGSMGPDEPPKPAVSREAILAALIEMGVFHATQKAGPVTWYVGELATELAEKLGAVELKGGA